MPLISYTLEAARKSKRISELYVSSDDADILEIARSFSCRLHERSEALATDHSPVTDTVRDILSQSKEMFDAVMILQPTSPLRTGQDIDRAIVLLEEDSSVESVISVVPMDDIHPARMYKLSEHGVMEPFMPEFEQARRQDIPVAYYRNGCIYLTRTEAFLKNNSLMNKPIRPYTMSFDWLLNIDSPRDIRIAEAIIPAWRKMILA